MFRHDSFWPCNICNEHFAILDSQKLHHSMDMHAVSYECELPCDRPGQTACKNPFYKSDKSSDEYLDVFRSHDG